MAAKKVSITTTVTTDKLTAESTNGDNYIIKFAGELSDSGEFVCAECEEYKRIREKHLSAHNRECPSFQKWVKQYPADMDKNPNTCETCNKAPEDRSDNCCHNVHPDFLKIRVTTQRPDYGSYQVVYFYTNTTSVDEVLSLMEKAHEWIERQRHTDKRED